MGPARHGDVDLHRAILAGRPIPVFNGGEMHRDFTYIDDIVSGVVACLDNPPRRRWRRASRAVASSPHRLYNIGNHRAEPLDRVIALLEDAIGRRAIREDLPMQPGDVTATFADIDAIRRDLGFEPRTAIDVGVPNFVRWYRDYHAA